MARYIDADELYKAAQKRIAEANEARMAVVDDEFLDLINDAFTEDVAPRAEFEALKDEADRYKRYYFRHDYDEMIAEAKAEVAREIFEEIEEYAELQIESLNIAEKVDLSGAAFFGGGKQAFVLLLDRLAELKKKYTEAETGLPEES